MQHKLNDTRAVYKRALVVALAIIIQNGITNFVSMLLIIGIVVVLAGLFLTLGKGVMNSITQKVMDFIKNL